MLSNPQKALLKRAQREAQLCDSEYREALELVTGCTTSTDPRIGDEQLDVLLAYFEAIYWRKADAGQLQPGCKAAEIFRQRGFWASRNRSGSTSRDRFSQSSLTGAIESLEGQLREFGYGEKYFSAIKQKVTRGTNNVRSLFAYRAALTKTLCSKQKAAVTQPF
jgi:hypothetical protein